MAPFSLTAAFPFWCQTTGERKKKERERDGGKEGRKKGKKEGREGRKEGRKKKKKEGAFHKIHLPVESHWNKNRK